MHILRIALATLFLLLIPFVAMQFNPDVQWGPDDFVGAGILLFGTGLTFELVAKKGGTVAYRIAVGLALAAALLLVWVNAAVGLIGDEDNPVNLMYGGVLAVGFLGAVFARLQPQGMARALFATALAQALVPLIALTVWKPQDFPEGGLRVVIANAFFVLLFVGSAVLFRRAQLQKSSSASATMMPAGPRM